MLAMAIAAAAVLAAALLEDDDLVEAVLRDHGRGNGRIDNQRGANGQVAIDAYGQHVVERDGATGLGIQLLDFQDRVRGNTILLSACADDSKHRIKLSRHYKKGRSGEKHPRRPEAGLIAAVAAVSTGKYAKTLRQSATCLCHRH